MERKLVSYKFMYIPDGNLKLISRECVVGASHLYLTVCVCHVVAILLLDIPCKSLSDQVFILSYNLYLEIFYKSFNKKISNLI